MAVTRIKNNQITDASGANTQLGVNAAVKLQNYSVTAGKLANSLVYGSDLTVSGNLTVNGTTTTVDTINTLIKDPILTLADGQTSGTPVVDIGLLGLRGNQNSSFLGWQESGTTFMAILSNTTASNTTVNVTSYANFTASTITAQGNLSVVGNIIGSANFTGNVTAGNLLTPGLFSATGNATAGNVLTGGLISATGNITGGNVLTAGVVSATANVTGGNVLTAGVVSATANVTGGNILTAGLISATSTITSAANITGGNILTGGLVSATSNITGGNVLTAGIVSATANITGGNVLTAGQVSATANITGGNVLTAGQVSATANITTAGAFNGATLSLSGNVTSALNVTGNIAGGNITTPGLISATGNATVGNVNTAGLVSATGNVTGGNVIAVALVQGANVSATANVTGGNILTAGLISAGGNITSATNVNTPNVVSTGNLTLTGGNVLVNPTSGNLVLPAAGTTYINNLAQPVQNNDAASKIYVDNMVSTQLAYHQAVVVATTANLATTTGGTITYAQPNGAANGIGATITTTGSFNLIDTANVQTANTRILVKNEGNAVLNGVYIWSNATVITRSTDADVYGPNSAEELSINDYFFVTSGNVNKGSAYIVDAPAGVITFGTSNITFAQFSSSQTYTGGNGISLYGTVISTVYDNSTIGVNGSNQLYIPANAPLVTPNIGAATGTSLSVTGAITAGTTLSSVGNTIAGNVTTVGLVSATGNVTGGNILTAGLMSSTGNAIHGNVLTAGVVSATANVTGGNILTAGIVSATGTITTAGNLSLTGNIVDTGELWINTSANGNINLNVNGTGQTNIPTGILSVTGNIQGGNLRTAGLISATANITGGNILTAGLISATGNLTAGNVNTVIVSATGQIVSTATGNLSDAGGQIYLNGTGNNRIDWNTQGTGAPTFTTRSAGTKLVLFPNLSGSTADYAFGIDSATLWSGVPDSSGSFKWYAGTTQIGNLSGTGAFSAAGNVTGANILTGGQVSATGNGTFGNIVLTDNFINQLQANSIININGASANTDFAVNGTTANLLYVDATTNTLGIGNSATLVNAIASFNAVTSIVLPTGTLGQRPSNASSQTGMLRFNTTNNGLEVYDNSGWSEVGGTTFTVIADEQFNGDGSTVAFTLGSSQTTNSCLVSINGVVQIPGSAYSVSGTDPTCVLTFTEAPAAGDLIDVREITTTTTVDALANASGNAEIKGSATAAAFDVTGNLIPTANVTYTLGNATNYWSSLYVGGNTIYLGGLQLQSAAGNVFTVTTDGSTPANVNITVSTTGNVSCGNIVNTNANGVGNIGSATTYFNTVFAKATSAQYADLAEKYVADQEYAPGTVVSFGGEKEVTRSEVDADRAVAGVVSTNPSYIMNATLEADHVAVVAFTGRVPTSVTGSVAKGDLMVSNGDGTARADADPKAGSIIGKALENFAGDTGVIEVVIGRF